MYVVMSYEIYMLSCNNLHTLDIFEIFGKYVYELCSVTMRVKVESEKKNILNVSYPVLDFRSLFDEQDFQSELLGFWILSIVWGSKY
jgi:hypothetical protein